MEKKVTVLVVSIAFLIFGNIALAVTAHDWLVNQQNATTGLLVSYEGDSNATAYTYDQACAVIALTCENDTTHAKKILDKIAALQNSDGSWYTAYNANTGAGSNFAKDTGNNSWMILAINYYTIDTGDQTYINSAKKCADFILTLQDNNPSNPTFGSVRINPDAPWISTEHQHDAYSALTGLGNILNNQYYNDKASLVYNWTVNNMWNDTEGRFYTGYNDYSKYLDPQSWSIPSIGTTGPAGQNFIRCLTWAYNNMHVTKTYNGQTLDGFDYDGTTTYPSGGIWFEGTEQMVLAYDIIGDATSANYFHSQTAKAQSSNGGIICATGDGGTSWPTNFPINAVAATSWYIFGSQNPRVNPFKPVPPAPDTTPPVISNVGSSNTTANSATITWTTDENSDSQIEYGLTTSYGNSSPLDTNLLLNHSVTISNLSANTVYHYRVHSKDMAGNTATSGDYTFSTLPETQTKDYGHTAMVLTRGTTNNSYTNLNANDGTYVTVKAAKSGSYYYSDWYAKTQISESPSKVTKLSITYDGHYSTSRPQEIFLYNFVSSVWARIDYQTISTTDKTITYTTTNASEITSYISSTGEIRLRIYTSRNRTYYCYADYVKFGIEYNSSSSSFAPRSATSSDADKIIFADTWVDSSPSLWTGANQAYYGTDTTLHSITDGTVTLGLPHGDVASFTYNMPKESWAGQIVATDGSSSATTDLSAYTLLKFKVAIPSSGPNVAIQKFFMQDSNGVEHATGPITINTTDFSQEYTIDLSGANLAAANKLFGFIVTSSANNVGQNTVTFYVDDIRFTANNDTTAPDTDTSITVNVNDVKIVGGKQGYINPIKIEKAQIVVNPGDSGTLQIKVYDLIGNLVWETDKGVTADNTENITWDGRNGDGEQVASGIYIVHISGAGLNQTKKIAIIK